MAQVKEMKCSDCGVECDISGFKTSQFSVIKGVQCAGCSGAGYMGAWIERTVVGPDLLTAPATDGSTRISDNSLLAKFMQKNKAVVSPAKTFAKQV